MLLQNPDPIESRPKEAKAVPCGYKTGTSIGFRDSWTAGFFGQYVLVVWIGNFDGSGSPSFLGRSAAAPLFFAIMDSIIADGRCQKESLQMPLGVKYVEVCSVSGNIPNENCPHKEETLFIPGISPIEKCKIHRKITIDTRSGFRTDDENSKYSKTVVKEFWPSDLMELFEKAGLPRLAPPPYPPESENASSEKGFPPQILSPLSYTEYVFRSQTPERNVIVLSASADGDSKELFWFANSAFILRNAPGEKSVWQPEPGEYDLTVSDQKGRCDTTKLVIRLSE